MAYTSSSRTVLSRWPGTQAFIAADAVPDTLVSNATVSAGATPDPAALERYNQASKLQDADTNRYVRFYRRNVAAGSIAYFVVRLVPQVHLEVLNADGATPGSDAAGDTIWLDGRKHLATVEQMVQAPYATREHMTLLAAMAFGFHGNNRTSDEGSVVVNGQVLRVNAGRAALCITADQQAQIGLFDLQALQGCEQAIGAGPVILWKGRITNPNITSASDMFVPFNPLGEDFVQLDWRKTVYNGLYPKSVIGISHDEAGNTYIVMVTSQNLTGMQIANELKAMGCSDALGGDDDSSTQAIWRGVAVQPQRAGAVPDALAVYLRN